MRIGIDCRTILNPESGERAGVGHYTYNLVRALLDLDQENEYVLFFDYRTMREAAQTFDQANVRIRFFPFSSYGKFLPFAYSHLLVAAALYKERLDVLHAPANIMPLGYAKTTVVTLHDLAIYKHPEWFPMQIFSTRLLVPQSLKKAKHIIAVSEATKTDLRELFNTPHNKVSVIPEAADTKLLPLHDSTDDIHAVYKLPTRYLLYIGTIEPRKNLNGLLQAWQRLQLNRPEVVKDVVLIFAGALGYGGQDFLPAVTRLKLKPTVKYLGYVPHNHKILLIRSAQAFIFPTFYEGFGLPVLEAMQIGTPVITTNTSSIKEVANKSALLVEPNDIDGMAEAMRKMLTDQEVRHQLITKGKQQAEKFSWERTARETLAVYRKAAQK